MSTLPPNASSPSDPNGVTGKLSSWISTTKLAEIPQEVQTRAKYLILDGLACALVGSRLPWSETASNAVFAMEPRGFCPVIGWGESHRLSPIASAILNSSYIQGFELDDVHSGSPLHSNSIILPALLSASKVSATPVTGADFLLAYIIGCEVGPRVGLALHGADLLSRGWHSGTVMGPSASAAAVSSLLRLPPNQVEDALGIACTQAGGLMAAQFGSMAKRMQHGFASRNGLFAALMAQGGYTGINCVYETPYGGFLSCFGQGITDFEPQVLPEEICSGLGTRWELDSIRVKLHACMLGLHGTIDCLENLQKRHPDRFSNLADIQRIDTRHGRAGYEHGGWKQPLGKPLTSTAAQMSIQYAAAAQLVDGQVLMAQFSADRLNRPEVVQLMHKVEPAHDASFDKNKKDKMRSVVKVTFVDGTVVEESLRAFKGIDPPVTNEGIVEKWRSLVKDVISEERMKRIEECVLRIDERENVIEELSVLLEEEVGKAIEA